ncbi:transcriptional regulator [Virgibacillus profundi]|uniref:Transcriptional regulator n=1 Tax=Virgibacillus profundi TaxID=2024555 RepID=A0A2A2IB25_9BACI|nr:helix-turn-helix transcriptional regulator [Virgibacillus profundi]PAV28588.1 transcriptional regulator [Virgibacillus profundi]PXY51769.1 XRE family transcriptional regulator [Virgibacillus profundi]
MDTKRVGRRIKAFRKLKGHTQLEFAEMLGVSIAVIGGVERGTKQITDELLDQIANSLAVSRNELTLRNKRGHTDA